jgi:hypothetical protein
MIEHGIYTTKADYWVHLFPLAERVFWYRVDHMREYIRLSNPPVVIGKSKDRTPTGAGYLVSQDEFFVSYAGIPSSYFHRFDWRAATDRECGFRGEFVVDVLVEHRIVTIPAFRLRSLRTKADQYESKDFKGSYFGDLYFETKTERAETGNLFVQTREGGHKVHLTNAGGQTVERISQAPELNDDWGPF